MLAEILRQETERNQESNFEAVRGLLSEVVSENEAKLRAAASAGRRNWFWEIEENRILSKAENISPGKYFFRDIQGMEATAILQGRLFSVNFFW